MSANLIPAIHALVLARRSNATLISVSVQPSRDTSKEDAAASRSPDDAPTAWAAQVHLGPGVGWDNVVVPAATPDAALRGLYDYYREVHDKHGAYRQRMLERADELARQAGVTPPVTA